MEHRAFNTKEENCCSPFGIVQSKLPNLNFAHWRTKYRNVHSPKGIYRRSTCYYEELGFREFSYKPTRNIRQLFRDDSWDKLARASNLEKIARIIGNIRMWRQIRIFPRFLPIFSFLKSQNQYCNNWGYSDYRCSIESFRRQKFCRKYCCIPPADSCRCG